MRGLSLNGYKAGPCIMLQIMIRAPLYTSLVLRTVLQAKYQVFLLAMLCTLRGPDESSMGFMCFRPGF